MGTNRKICWWKEKTTHMWRWHTPQDFCLHLLMNLKNNYLFKDLLKRTNKKCKNFKIQNDAFFLKNKEKHLETSLGYTCVMIYSSWDIECDRLKLLIMGHFLTLHPSIKARKKKNFEKMKKIAGDITILHMCTKNPDQKRLWNRCFPVNFVKLLRTPFSKVPVSQNMKVYIQERPSTVV